jgi:hypothetical protein
MIDRYDLFGRRMEDTEPDMLARFVRFDQHNDRIRELEAAIKMVIARTDNPWVVHKLSDALNGEKRAARHKVTCKLFPDPFDERDPVGPCTCSPLSDATHDQGDDLARERRCNCGWPRTTDGEHGNNCPVATPDRGDEHG